MQAEPATSAGSLWKHADFLKLWAAQSISVTGDQFTGLAIPLIATLTLGATPAQMGILAALERAPFLILSLFAGIWVDRLPRRPILIGGDLGRALVLLSIPLAAFSGSVRMAQLYVVALLVGVLTVFFDVSYMAFLPSLVDRRLLIDGNSKLETSRSLASLAGPSIAGIVIQTLSAPIAIILDALSFLISGTLLATIRRREPPQEQSTRAPMIVEAREGLSTIFGNRYLRSIAGCTGTINFFSSALYALYILFATRNLGLGPAKIGLIMGLGNASGLFGALIAGRVGARLGLGRAIVGSAFGIGLGVIPIMLATPGNAFAMLVAAGLIGSFAGPVYNINQVSLRQAITPHRLQGRMNASMRFLVWGTMPIGGLAGGFLGDILGVRATIQLAAAGMLLSFLWVLLSPVRGLRTIPEPAD